jgi:bisphosphoglycerate-independent phosphoglycerate mutase (AlkP superfamily)
VLDRHEDALARGQAVASEIVNDGWKRHLGLTGLPDVTPAEAGATLARIAGGADLTLFAHYATDGAGHARAMGPALDALARVDAFLEGVVGGLAPDTLLLVASDHGNLEDVRAGHTRNPALGLAVGPGADAAAELNDLRQVTPFVLRMLGVHG